MIQIPTKYYVYIALGLAILYGVFMTSQFQSQKDRADRMTDNFIAMQDSTARLIRVTKKEMLKVLDERTDSIIKVANIKPKWIREIHNVTNNYHIKDTTIVKTNPPVEVNDTLRYPFDEKIDCMTIEGFMTVDTFKVPHLYLTSGTGYENKTTSIVYERRQKYKFLFWHWRLLGKKKYELHTESECGETKTEIIKVEKK